MKESNCSTSDLPCNRWWILCIAKEGIGGSILNDEIGKYFPFKTGSVGPPDICLGGKLKKIDVGNGVWAWSFSPCQYIKAAVDNVKKLQPLPKKAINPFKNQGHYRPETDTTEELDVEDSAYYQ